MFAVLHIADFPLQARLRALGRLAPDAAVALVDPEARPARVLACTAAARACGVETGQSSSQALARCPSLRLLEPRADAEAEASAALLTAAFGVSPHVEATSAGVCTIAVAALPAEAREPSLLRAVDQLAALALHATAGLAPTPLLALYAARLADPLRVVDDARTFLSALPLDAAEPPDALRPVLAGWGVRTLGDLCALPKPAIARRLGPAGVALWERAAGEATRPLQLVAPAQTFSAEMECEHEMETLEPVLFLLRRFVDRLALELAQAALAAGSLEVTLRLADDTALTHTLRLPEPSTRADILFGVLQTWLETVRTAAAVFGVRLTVNPTRVAARQPGFFDRALRDPHRFSETLARLAAIVGADRVGTPRPVDTHRPDAFTLEPPASALETFSAPAGMFVHPPQGLVLRRFRPPLPAQVEREGTAPAHVRAHGIEGCVRAHAGPWHASGDWWQPDQVWAHEAWDVQIGAALYRITRSGRAWFVEGEYD